MPSLGYVPTNQPTKPSNCHTPADAVNGIVAQLPILQNKTAKYLLML